MYEDLFVYIAIANYIEFIVIIIIFKYIYQIWEK